MTKRPSILTILAVLFALGATAHAQGPLTFAAQLAISGMGTLTELVAP
ncbi:MAG: hypothetical protein AAGH41_13080 [Pseudomonadota bacterium]